MMTPSFILLQGSSEKSKAALRNRLSEVKFVVIDEFYVVPSDLWTDIDSKLEEIFMMILKKVFACLSGMTLTDLFQLPPVRGNHIFSQFSGKDCLKHLLGL